MSERALRAPTVSAMPSPQVLNTPASFSLSLEDDLELGGFVFQNGDPLLHTDGGYAYGNTALGLYALVSSMPGSGFNTAVGRGALRATTTGGDNTAMGTRALRYNTTGHSNTGIGSYALWYNTSGSLNIAVGALALLSNTEGSYNLAVGRSALENNVDGSRNIGIGERALYNNISGVNHTAMGFEALFNANSLYPNTAVGFRAGKDITTGNYNTAVGPSAGGAWTTGSYNVAIGTGSVGVAGESGVIRIGGLNNQSTTYIEGISDGEVLGNPVCVAFNDEVGLCPGINLQAGQPLVSPQLWDQLRRQDAELAELRKLVLELRGTVADQRRRLEHLEKKR